MLLVLLLSITVSRGARALWIVQIDLRNVIANVITGSASRSSWRQRSEHAVMNAVCEARSDGHIQQQPLRGTVKVTTVATASSAPTAAAASMALTATMPEKEALLAETVVDRLGR